MSSGIWKSGQVGVMQLWAGQVQVIPHGWPLFPNEQRLFKGECCDAGKVSMSLLGGSVEPSELSEEPPRGEGSLSVAAPEMLRQMLER